MDDRFENTLGYEENYKSYSDIDFEFNPDDYEGDYWEDILPDRDEQWRDVF